jgi:hypothetical protein
MSAAATNSPRWHSRIAACSSGSAPVARASPSAATAYYVGRRSEATEVYIVSSTGFEPLSHPSYQSSAAFDWGFASAGALELSFAADTTESRPTELVCRTFCAEVVARLEDAGFVLTAGDIAAWLMGTFSYADSPGRGARAGLSWSALQWVRSRLGRT